MGAVTAAWWRCSHMHADWGTCSSKHTQTQEAVVTPCTATHLRRGMQTTTSAVAVLAGNVAALNSHRQEQPPQQLQLIPGRSATHR